MTDVVRKQVETVIRNRWLVLTDKPRISGSFWYVDPVSIEGDEIVLKWYDAGHRPKLRWSVEEWRKYVKDDDTGLYERVGIYSFESVNEHARHLIRGCHSNPAYYGRRLYEAELKIKTLEETIEDLKEELRCTRYDGIELFRG